MDQHRVPTLTRSLTSIPSRRDVLRGLVGAGFGLGVARFPAITEARKKKKGKKKKTPKSPQSQPNQYGCLSVGATCQNAGQCCSGICEGKQCRAHGAGTCGQELRGVCIFGIADAAQHVCDNNANCGCYRTTADSVYCTAGLYLQEGDPKCADCQKDADCLALGYPPGSACAPVSRGFCAGFCPTGMACLVPCGTDLS